MASSLVTSYMYTEDRKDEEEKAMLLKNVALQVDRQTYFINFEKQNTNQSTAVDLAGGGTGYIVGLFGTSFKINVTNIASILKSVKGGNGKRIFEIKFLEGHVQRDYYHIQNIINATDPNDRPLDDAQKRIGQEPVYVKLHVSTNTTPYDFSIAPSFDKGQGATIYLEEFPSGNLGLNLGIVDCVPGQSQGCIREANAWYTAISPAPNPIDYVVGTNQQITSVNFRLSVRVLHSF